MLSPFPILRIFEKLWLDLAAMFEFEPSSRIFHDYELAAMLSPSSSFYFFWGVSFSSELPRNHAKISLEFF